MRGGRAVAGYRTACGDIGRWFGRAADEHIDADLDATLDALLHGRRVLQLADGLRRVIEHLTDFTHTPGADFDTELLTPASADFASASADFSGYLSDLPTNLAGLL
jgi:hypothetical protein